MASKRRNLSLAELIARLRPLESQGINSQSTVFNDLQTGFLVAEVAFPSFRSGITAVRKEYWKEYDYHSFQAVRDEEFYISLTALAPDERDRLRRTTLAICDGPVTEIDHDYRTFFQSEGWMNADGSIANKRELIDFCFWAQHELTKDESRNAEFQVWVQSPHPQDYLEVVQSRLHPPTARAARADNWTVIYEELIRRLIRDPSALDKGRVTLSLRELADWAAKTHGTTKVPGYDRIRQVVDPIIKSAKKGF